MSYLNFKTKKLQKPDYPKELKSIGDYIRKTRLDRNLFQKNVAQIFKVSTDTITNWEKNRFIPQSRYHKRIFEFIGFNPIDEVR